MKKSRPYQAASVKQISITNLIEGRGELACDVGLDCSKHEVLVVVRWQPGSFERPWRVRIQEGDLPVLVALLTELRQGRQCQVALEPTGSYCDPVRQALSQGGFPVYRVHTKVSHDYAEILDGVPSQHDGKDAAVVAELCALGKRSVWPERQENSALRRELDWLEQQTQARSQWLARIEAELGRYWPELGGLLSLTSNSLIGLLRHYGGPGPLLQDHAAAQKLTELGRGGLRPEKVAKVMESARTTIGVRQEAEDVAQLQRYAAEAWRCHQAYKQSKKCVADLLKDQPLVARLGQVVGLTTASVCWAYLGDPRQYHSGKAYVKAMGLNLKERSSGRFQGQLKISKRGSSRPRRWLYFAALRKIQTPWLRPWYEAKKLRQGNNGQRTIVAVMRKLALALYQVAKQDVAYSDERLVPGAARYQPRPSSTASRERKRQAVGGVASNGKLKG